MNPDNTRELTVESLMAYRKQTDAIRIITENLRVKEMGPADHIRTKHEVKAFVESAGSITAAAAIIGNARARRFKQEKQTAAIRITEHRGQNISQ